MKSILISCLLLTAFTLQSQITSIDCMGSLDIGYRDIHEKRSNVSEGFLKLKKKEQIGFRNRFGFNYNIQISQRFHFKTGLRFVNKGYNSYKYKDSDWGLTAPEGTFVGNEPSESGGSLQYKYNMFFIEVPVILRYKLAQRKKFEFYCEAGVAPSYLIDAITVQRFNSDRKQFKDTNSNYNNWQVAAVMGVGANYQIKEKTQLYAQPTYSYDITKIVNAPLNVHLYSIGLELGCRHIL